METGGAHIATVVREREEVVDVLRRHEEVTDERVTLNRTVEAPVAVCQEGDTLIIPLWEEVVVREKRLSVQEEIWITIRRIEEQTSQPATLRRAEVVVKRLGPSQQPQTFGKESAHGENDCRII